MKKIFRGFTLLELLVVIGIIGVLMALATVAYSSTQKSGRNTRRKQDLVSMQSALEQYYGANSFLYPATCSLASEYMKSPWPVDPSSPTYTYVENPACSTSEYCICATMEGGTGGNSGAQCDYESGSKAFYCVSNLQ